MDRKGVPKQQYIDTLDGLSRQRYLDKLRVIDNVDPYTLPSGAWGNWTKQASRPCHTQTLSTI